MAQYLPDECADPLATRVLRFWFGSPPQYGTRLKRWFAKEVTFDASCRELFLHVFDEICAGGRRNWLEHRADCLARIIVLDQFPRNMFRDTARAFSGDGAALESARHLAAQGWDGDLVPVEKHFAYLPFEHSEALEDQLKACQLTAPLAAFPETDDAYRYAVAHRDIIARFGRYPHRNAALGRASTPEELAFLKVPGSSF
jgi:uncharacterized protein (DUF924 family)